MIDFLQEVQVFPPKTTLRCGGGGVLPFLYRSVMEAPCTEARDIFLPHLIIYTLSGRSSTKEASAEWINPPRVFSSSPEVLKRTVCPALLPAGSEELTEAHAITTWNRPRPSPRNSGTPACEFDVAKPGKCGGRNRRPRCFVKAIAAV